MKHTLILAAAIALAGASTHAAASGAFIRAEVGSADTEARYGGLRESDSDTSALFGGGYWFTPNIAVEGHAGTLYTEDLGYDTDFDLVTFGVGVALKHNFGADGTGFFVGARAGVARMVAQIREDTFDVVDDEGSTKPYYGATLGYDINRRWGLSLNYTRHRGEFSGIEVDVENVTVGGEFRF
ncbi:outer membrane beta-barrel protein [Luteimonas sp. TWI1416]|uniref:outer membrane beta-barrel protein n=1 Tax=unclassified Luteimonas TaxID=2629088 RepID=UPI00320B68F7